MGVASTARAQLARCSPSCFEKTFTLALDANANGLPDPGDIVRFEVTYCNARPVQPGQEINCTSYDEIDALNHPDDLTLVADPSDPNSFGDCVADDAGQTGCAPATTNGVSIASCSFDLDTDTIWVDATVTAEDACFTYYFFARINPARSDANGICNQAIGSTGVSDDPASAARPDPTLLAQDVVPSDQGNVLRAIRQDLDVRLDLIDAPATAWRFYRDVDPLDLGTTRLVPDTSEPWFVDKDIVPEPPVLMFYQVKGLSLCTGVLGP